MSDEILQGPFPEITNHQVELVMGSSINFFLGCTGWNVLTPLRHCLIPC